MAEDGHSRRDFGPHRTRTERAGGTGRTDPTARQAARRDARPPYRQTVDEALAALGTDADTGLSSDEARSRLRQHGANRLVEERQTPAWLRFLAQFKDALVILLLAAGAVSAVIWILERENGLPSESIAIFMIVLLNAILGFVQQSRANRAVAALRSMTAEAADAIRDGSRQGIPAAELVPGDIILIEEGDTIPADARLIRSTALTAAEAALTGESVPVQKNVDVLDADCVLGDRCNMVFAGTAAAYGRGRAVVTATGMQTEMGHIAGLLKETPEEKTPLQRELDRVGRLLGIIVVIIALVMIAAILLVEDVRGFAAIFDVLILGVALAVAAVPEGLPAVVTAVLAIGVQRMARRNAIVRHLAAVETLGSADVIASDKTGTLTRNEMTVRAVVSAAGRVDVGGTGYAPEGALQRAGGGEAAGTGEIGGAGDVAGAGEVGADAGEAAGTGNVAGEVAGALRAELICALTIAERANNAALQESGGLWTLLGDPTEGALIVAARKAGLQPDAMARRYPRLAEIPFSSERKLMSTAHGDAEHEDRILLMTKGAPDVLLGRCSAELAGDALRPLSDERRAEILAANAALAGEALRTLGVAFKASTRAKIAPDALDAGVESDLVFAGLIGMLDPPRPEAKAAAGRAQRAGIRPIMITGDHPQTAAAIADELGIAEGGLTLTGADLEKMTDAALDDSVSHVSVYARVSPEHKLRIVRALQRRGAIVAMTGDGVNDAPALKTADVGIAMGITGTDVSKQAGDIVLADDNFASIVAAVEEGRTIFANIRKFLRYLLSSNIGEVMTMLFGLLLAGVIGLPAGQDGNFALPLLATQILWVNLVTDGAPALALGIDPPDENTMSNPPRPRTERVITLRMWRGIFFVGAVVTAGTLYVLDASLPGGLATGSGTLPYGQTRAFNTLVLFSLFNVFNARSDERSAFRDIFSNGRLWAAVLLSLLLQAAVIYVPFLQSAFSTVPLSLGDWLMCAAIASSVLWLREIAKLAGRSKLAVLNEAPRG